MLIHIHVFKERQFPQHPINKDYCWLRVSNGCQASNILGSFWTCATASLSKWANHL